MPAAMSHRKSRNNASVPSWTRCESVLKTGLVISATQVSMSHVFLTVSYSITTSLPSSNLITITPSSHLHLSPHSLSLLRPLLQPSLSFTDFSLNLSLNFLRSLRLYLRPGLWRSTVVPATPTRSRDWRSPAATASEYRPSATLGRVLSLTHTPSAPPSLYPLPSKVNESGQSVCLSVLLLHGVCVGVISLSQVCIVQLILIYECIYLQLSHNKVKFELLKGRCRELYWEAEIKQYICFLFDC